MVKVSSCDGAVCSLALVTFKARLNVPVFADLPALTLFAMFRVKPTGPLAAGPECAFTGATRL